ncbi:hypothetical protein [Clostridium tunisiense]|uniref:hypothetical protein n=1 Tax=Clostridium tunisiense TaxID=219748 RepID=UPI0002EC8FDA|nr:hypothetical protein [Clostridium tunisiense]
MKSKEKLVRMLYLLSAILFFIAAIIGKNYVFIPIGCCFIVLGITQSSIKR